jgi:hypothetical protein
LASLMAATTVASVTAMLARCPRCLGLCGWRLGSGPNGPQVVPPVLGYPPLIAAKRADDACSGQVPGHARLR